MRFSTSGIETKQLGAAPAVTAMLKRLDFAGLVNRTVRWDEKQWRTSPGILASALVVNALDGRAPLYMVEHYFEHLDTEGLFGPGVIPACFTDDALGQTLDRIHEAGAGGLYTKLATAAISAFGLNCLNLHADTTSWSLAGAYDQAEGTFVPARGHSKDRRPEDKQFLYGLVVNREGVPVRGWVRNGNLDDKTWNSQAIEAVGNLLTSEERKQVIYVADSACVTKGNLQRVATAEMSFISRLPATFGLVDELKAAALQAGAWIDVGTLREGKNHAAYKVQAFERLLYGQTYRFIVVHSTHLAQQKQRTLQRQAQREYQDVTGAAAELAGKSFSCRADAERAAQEFQAEYEGLYALRTEIHEVVQTKRRPGRPKAGEKPTEITTYRAEVTIGELQSDLLQALQDEQSLFILVTNLLDAVQYPPEAILREYKEQSSVEVRFRFLKDPAFVDGFFVKDTGRLEALAYLMLVALLVYALIERAVRSGLRTRTQILIGPGGVKHEAPTGRVVLSLLAPIQVLLLNKPSGRHRCLSDLDASQLLVLELLDLRPEVYVEIAAHAA